MMSGFGEISRNLAIQEKTCRATGDMGLMEVYSYLCGKVLMESLNPTR